MSFNFLTFSNFIKSFLIILKTWKICPLLKKCLIYWKRTRHLLVLVFMEGKNTLQNASYPFLSHFTQQFLWWMLFPKIHRRILDENLSASGEKLHFSFLLFYFFSIPQISFSPWNKPPKLTILSVRNILFNII